MTPLSEKLVEIEAAFNTLGWQPEDTFHPKLMLLCGDDLEVVCVNRIRDMWNELDVGPGLGLLYMALQSEPDEIRKTIFVDQEDVRGVALYTEGWAVIGSKERVEAAMAENERLTRETPDSVEHRVVMGVLFDEVELADVVWGAHRLRGDDKSMVDQGYGGGVSSAFISFARELKKAFA